MLIFLSILKKKITYFCIKVRFKLHDKYLINLIIFSKKCQIIQKYHLFKQHKGEYKYKDSIKLNDLEKKKNRL